MAIDIIFVLGPSGVGKSELSSALAKKLDYEFYEIDQHPADGIDEHKLRREWDEFWLNSRPEPLVDALRERAHAAEKKGIVLGFPSLLILKGAHLRGLSGKVSGARIAVRTTLTPDDLSTAANREPSIVSWSQTTTCGTRSMVAFLACCAHHSSVGRISHRGTEDRSPTQIQEEEYEHLVEAHIERLHEVTRPRHVVSQERRPALPVT